MALPHAPGPSPDEQLVVAHVRKLAATTFREPQGMLRFPYLVPAGPYNQLWDWDSLFLGVATRQFGSLPYLAGSMMNFLDHVNTTDGTVQGCLLPQGGTGVIYHAKPVVVQGGWLAVAYGGANASDFLPFQAAMVALRDYWFRAPQRDAATGLHVWHDQLQSGSDNLVTSQCPSNLSACWRPSDAFTLAAPDLQVLLYRELVATALFHRAWAAAAAEPRRRQLLSLAAGFDADAAAVLAAMEAHLWDGQRHIYTAFNVSSRQAITSRTWVMGLPLWGRLAREAKAAGLIAQVTAADMVSPWGLRSTSAQDPRYSNANIIKPYSNWRGPVWVNANAMLVYGLQAYSNSSAAAGALALEVATRVVAALAGDLRNTSTWHECLSSATGHGLAAPGFLSWDTLGATLLADVRQGVDPFALSPLSGDV